MYLIGTDYATNALFALLWKPIHRALNADVVGVSKAGLFQPSPAPGWKTETPDGTSVPGVGNTVDRGDLFAFTKRLPTKYVQYALQGRDIDTHSYE